MQLQLYHNKREYVEENVRRLAIILNNREQDKSDPQIESDDVYTLSTFTRGGWS